MKINSVLFIYTLSIGLNISAQISPLQKEAVSYINAHQTTFSNWSDSIWLYAEPSFNEYKSAKLIISILKKEGFTVQENVSGFPTVFIASYGNSKPVIGLYGEYDADPNASNKTVPYKEALTAGGYGHGGAHNLLGVGSLATALTIKNLITKGKLNCTVRYYGSTAEGGLGTRTFLARDGYFNDLDLSLYWHPTPKTGASTGSWDALIDFEVQFTAKRTSALAIKIPDDNTQNASEIFISEISGLRRKLPQTMKINYAFKQAKGSLNSITDTLKIDFRIQCVKQAEVLALFDSVKNVLKRVEDITKVKSEIKVNKALHQFLPNIAAMRQVFKNIELLDAISYTREEIDFGLKMQNFAKSKADTIRDFHNPFKDNSKRDALYGFASDIGDASWIAPEIYFEVRCFPSGVNMHTWQGSAFTAHSIGHKGMLQAAKLMSMTIIDYVNNKPLQGSIKKEFEENTKLYKYKPIITTNDEDLKKILSDNKIATEKVADKSEHLNFTGKTFLALTVPDADTAAAWYSRIFDLKMLKGINDTANNIVVRIAGNENMLVEILSLKGSKKITDCGLTEKDGSVFIQGFVKTGFYVKDLDAAKKQIVEKGVKIMHGPFSDDAIKSRSFIIEDCYGNMLQFFEK